MRTLPPPLGLLAILVAPTVLGAQFQNLRFRSIGPAVMGGRIHDIEGVPRNPAVLYVASASGGLWKSVNKGTTWAPIFDDQPVSTFGDVAIAPSNPDVVWAGTGEQNNRQSTSWGNGVYRSTDAGATWTHLGLERTRHIGRVRVHPANSDVAFVAALGDLWAPSPDRGVYKTTDGGKTWAKVLYVDSLTGVVDLAMDPANPDVLYAAAYQRLRRAWGFNGGGPGSGIYKTTDGGRTWTKLTNGIPAGDKGRIGLALAASNPRVLNAIIEHATEGGVYRTEDAGATWVKVNTLNPRPMYYSHIFIDPNRDTRVYVIAVTYFKSDDGGRNFRRMPHAPTYDVGTKGDFHAMWIDPGNSDHFFLGSDGGLHETWDQGETFTKINNFAVGQFYAIGVDMRAPYYIYGGMQDNHSWLGPSATRTWEGILHDDWKQIGFGDGMYHSIDPTNHRYVYTNAQNGELQRVDPETGDRLDLEPTPPPGEPPYRWDWVTPSLVSQHDPKVVYFGGNRLFISRDRGVTWERTDDLTRRVDRDTLRLMGVRGAERMLSKNDGEQSFSEILTIAESPLDPKILWVGTDDGNVQVSRDGGHTWTEVSPPPLRTYVSRVIASVAGPGVAYATFDAHRDGDLKPYVFRTENFGRTWTPLVQGLPASGSVNVIREHPKNPSLLFLGTEHALFVSTDRGREWRRLKANLPTTLYDDLVIHPRDNDLIVATHGRSLWILDDLAPLVEWSPEFAGHPLHLFSIRPAMIFNYWKAGSYRGQGDYAGENPAEGVLIDYHLARPADSVRVTITNAAGRVVRRFSGPGAPGQVHRVTWDLRHESPPTFAPDFGEGGGGGGGGGAGGGPGVTGPSAQPALPHPVTARGPFVSPGTYTARLEAVGGDAGAMRPFEVRGDTLLPLTDAQWREREEFLVALLEDQRRAADAAQRARSLPDSLRALRARVNAVRGGLNGLAGEFNGAGVRQGSLYPPTTTHRQRYRALAAALAEVLAQLPVADR
ncbi:MAG: VPS10 domain-containing protein [Gemmatimonadales bacterium]